METLYQILFNCKLHDEKSYLKLIEKFQPLLKKYAYLLNYEDAYNDMQLALLELTQIIPIQNFKNNDNDAFLISYISKSMKNKYIALSSKNQKTQSHMLLSLDEMIDCTDENNKDIKFNIVIELNLDSLTELQKKVIICRYYYGYSDVEIAKILGISRQAVNKLRNRGIEKLRTLF